MSGAVGRIVAAAQEAWRDQDPSESRSERRDRIEAPDDPLGEARVVAEVEELVEVEAEVARREQFA